MTYLISYALDDYDHWSNQPFWHYCEAVLLSMGLDPLKFPSAHFQIEIERCYSVVERVSEFKKKWDILKRYILTKKINERDHPLMFLALGQELGWNFANQLCEKVKTRVAKEIAEADAKAVETKKQQIELTVHQSDDYENLDRKDVQKLKNDMLYGMTLNYFSSSGRYKNGTIPKFSTIGQAAYEALPEDKKKQRGNKPENFAKALSAIYKDTASPITAKAKNPTT